MLKTPGPVFCFTFNNKRTLGENIEMKKEQMENWLSGKLQNTSYSFQSNCTNTPIYRNGRVLLDIYYRSNGQIRMAVSPILGF